MLLVFSLQRWTANASRAAITGRSRNLPLNVDPLPASGAALFLPRSLRLKTRTAGITEPSVFWASVQIPTYIRPLIRNRGKPLLASSHWAFSPSTRISVAGVCTCWQWRQVQVGVGGSTFRRERGVLGMLRFCGTVCRLHLSPCNIRYTATKPHGYGRKPSFRPLHRRVL